MPVSITCKTCGKEFLVSPSYVAKGKKYCSRKCYHPMTLLTHGMSGTRLHDIWCGMWRRCRSKKPFFVKYYSGRGIAVCKEWEKFEPFRDWAMANGYADDLELDRKDNDAGYSPENCRWATRVQQMANTRKRANAKTSKYKGVSAHSQNKGTWIAQICTGKNGPGKPTNLGSFKSEIEAAKAYDAAAREHFGSFANTNFKE